MEVSLLTLQRGDIYFGSNPHYLCNPQFPILILVTCITCLPGITLAFLTLFLTKFRIPLGVVLINIFCGISCAFFIQASLCVVVPHRWKLVSLFYSLGGFLLLPTLILHFWFTYRKRRLKNGKWEFNKIYNAMRRKQEPLEKLEEYITAMKTSPPYIVIKAIFPKERLMYDTDEVETELRYETWEDTTHLVDSSLKGLILMETSRKYQLTNPLDQELKRLSMNVLQRAVSRFPSSTVTIKMRMTGYKRFGVYYRGKINRFQTFTSSLWFPIVYTIATVIGYGGVFQSIWTFMVSKAYVCVEKSLSETDSFSHRRGEEVLSILPNFNNLDRVPSSPLLSG